VLLVNGKIYNVIGYLYSSSPHLPVSTDARVVFAGGSRFVQLIDFGQSIDMSKYPAGTSFLTKVDTQCFQCIEMKTNQPWTYQVRSTYIVVTVEQTSQQLHQESFKSIFCTLHFSQTLSFQYFSLF